MSQRYSLDGLGKIQTLASLTTAMKMMCFCNVTWDLFAKEAKPSCLRGSKPASSPLFHVTRTPNSNATFQRGDFWWMVCPDEV